MELRKAEAVYSDRGCGGRNSNDTLLLLLLLLLHINIFHRGLSFMSDIWEMSQHFNNPAQRFYQPDQWSQWLTIAGTKPTFGPVFIAWSGTALNTLFFYFQPLQEAFCFHSNVKKNVFFNFGTSHSSGNELDKDSWLIHSTKTVRRKCENVLFSKFCKNQIYK